MRRNQEGINLKEVLVNYIKYLEKLRKITSEKRPLDWLISWSSMKWLSQNDRKKPSSKHLKTKQVTKGVTELSRGSKKMGV